MATKEKLLLYFYKNLRKNGRLYADKMSITIMRKDISNFIKTASKKHSNSKQSNKLLSPIFLISKGAKKKLDDIKNDNQFLGKTTNKDKVRSGIAKFHKTRTNKTK